MGFFDFLKKKKEKEIIVFTQIKDWISSKKNELEKNKKEFFSEIKEKIYKLIINLEKCLLVLEKVNLDNKKAEEKIKIIVMENLETYISYMKRLMSSLKEIEIENPNEVINQINKLILDFNEKTYINFHKSTILIGDELGSVKDAISRFLEETNLLLKQNKEFIDTYNAVFYTEEKLREIEFIEKLTLNIDENLRFIKEKIEFLNQDKKKTSSEIAKVQCSSEYLKEVEDHEAINKKERELNEEIMKLRKIIDFKTLSSIFHPDSKKMKIINEYKGDFKESFEKDNCHGIIKLMKEANIDSANLSDEIENVSKIKKLIEKNKQELKDNLQQSERIKSLEVEIKVKDLEISALKDEETKETKKFEKFENTKKGLIELIRNKLETINIGII